MKKSQDISISSPEYRRFIEQLKSRVLSARLSAARAVNCDLILPYATYIVHEFLAQAAREIDRHKTRRFLRQLAAEIPWVQNLFIINKVTDSEAVKMLEGLVT